MTGAEICKYISDSGILKNASGNNPTADEIWNYSSTGELFSVFALFVVAVQFMKLKGNKVPEEYERAANEWNKVISSELN